MKTLIQQLADQAKSQVPQGILSPDLWIEQYNQRFAELIVHECIELVASRPYIDDGNWSHPSMLIKRHFGVE